MRISMGSLRTYCASLTGKHYCTESFLQHLSCPRQSKTETRALPPGAGLTIEEEVRDVCKQLVASKDGDAAIVLARRLRELLHQLVQNARDQVRILPLLDKAQKDQNAA